MARDLRLPIILNERDVPQAEVSVTQAERTSMHKQLPLAGLPSKKVLPGPPPSNRAQDELDRASVERALRSAALRTQRLERQLLD